ncbi:hypothetical protein [Limosilactobacillus sp.]|uniref:hypothetical protein n=1 Tax=Limosilactobacillus sp. TaxID=2773925 RepID=UPI0025BB4512|nr:hypothetical protein [Limosilactobacillus sp.]MCH3922800.1 hypothetical protein [Limosilactobacillus sp.]MCH3927483.1 hypothetical protein [Limosilactobacillus sp.]
MGRRFGSKNGMRTKTPYVYKGRHVGPSSSSHFNFRGPGRPRRNMTPREAAWAIVMIIVACIAVAFIGLKIGTSNSQSQNASTLSRSVSKQSSSAESKDSKAKQKKRKSSEISDRTNSAANSNENKGPNGSRNSNVQASSASTLSNREVDDRLAQELAEIKAAANQYHQNNNGQEFDERLDTIENKNEQLANQTTDEQTRDALESVNNAVNQIRQDPNNAENVVNDLKNQDGFAEIWDNMNGMTHAWMSGN